MKIVVFCGGSGTRLWPLGRKAFPKQFQKLVGDRTMFQMTMDRLRSGFSIDDIFVCTGTQFRDLVLKQCPELPASNVIEEPEMRDTAAAVAYSTAYIDSRYPGESMAAIWGADHVIKNEVNFVESLLAAEHVSKEHDALTFVGIHVKEPNIHLGYIEMGEKAQTSNNFDVFSFSSFKEKPDLETAKVFCESGKYAGNAGYFVVHPKTLLGYFKKYAPDFFKKIEIIQESLETSHKSNTIKEIYASFEKMAIDHLLWEKLTQEKIYVIPVDMGWSDIGAWQILYEEQEKDHNNNVVKALHRSIDTKNCLIYGSDKKVIATIGLDDLIIVDTEDALLICPKGRDQDVKKMVKEVFEAEDRRFI